MGCCHHRRALWRSSGTKTPPGAPTSDRHVEKPSSQSSISIIPPHVFGASTHCEEISSFVIDAACAVVDPELAPSGRVAETSNDILSRGRTGASSALLRSETCPLNANASSRADSEPASGSASADISNIVVCWRRGDATRGNSVARGVDPTCTATGDACSGAPAGRALADRTISRGAARGICPAGEGETSEVEAVCKGGAMG